MLILHAPGPLQAVMRVGAERCYTATRWQRNMKCQYNSVRLQVTESIILSLLIEISRLALRSNNVQVANRTLLSRADLRIVSQSDGDSMTISNAQRSVVREVLDFLELLRRW